MGWYDSTNAILGINEQIQNKKNSTWQKLMDIASLGANIWQVLSGRKYQTGEREAGEEFTLGRDVEARKHDETMARLNAELDEARAGNNQERAIELQREIARLQEEQAKRDYPREMNLRTISAGGSAPQRANDLFDVINNIKQQAQGTHWNIVTDEAGNAVIEFIKSPEETMAYFDKLIAAAKLSSEDAETVRQALRAWMENPSAPGAGTPTAEKPSLDTNALVQQLLASLTPQIQSYLASLQPAEKEAFDKETQGNLTDLLKPGGEYKWAITPGAAKELPRSSQYGKEKEEATLAALLTGYIPFADTQEKADIQKAIAALRDKGIMDWGPYAALVAFKNLLAKKYANTGRR